MKTLRIPGPTVLVTGGLGYIGSHTVVALNAAGYRVVILDNLVNSERTVLADIQSLCDFPLQFVEADVRDPVLLESILGQHRIFACIHFAGLKAVGDSVARPLEYYDVNVVGSLTLLQSLLQHGVTKLVFSSSATVYGNPTHTPIGERQRGDPINPYGRTKWMVEQILQDACVASPALAVMALRYFNPAGAHVSGLIGERPTGTPNNLMPYISQVASGERESLSVFGGDYSTPDGTGVRDYVHVSDLAHAHVLALKKLSDVSGYRAVNIGTGQGYSVLEVLAAFEKATGQAIAREIVSRRDGDIAECYADPGLAKALLGWESKKSLVDMCKDAWRFESRVR